MQLGGIHSLRSNWPGARREGGSVSAAILDRLSNEASGQFQRNPKGGMSFGRRRCCSLLTDPLRDRLWWPCGSTSRLASAQNPLPRMYSYFGDTTLAPRPICWLEHPLFRFGRWPPERRIQSTPRHTFMMNPNAETLPVVEYLGRRGKIQQISISVPANRPRSSAGRSSIPRARRKT